MACGLWGYEMPEDPCTCEWYCHQLPNCRALPVAKTPSPYIGAVQTFELVERDNGVIDLKEVGEIRLIERDK